MRALLRGTAAGKLSINGGTMRKSCIACALALAACSPAPSHDGVLAQHDGAAFIGMGRDGEIDAAIQCDDNERLGDPDWPAIAAWMSLPEAGEEFEAAGKGYAVVDGRKVKIDLSVRIDGRDFPVVDKKVRHDEQLQRALLVGRVEGGEALFKAISKAKVIEIAGDGRKLRADVSSATQDRKEVADACRNIGAPA